MGALAVNLDTDSLCNPSAFIRESEVLDLKHLARYTLGDEGLKREILDLFRTQIVTSLANLRDAAEADDELSWQMAAHTLKGSARAVGAFRLGAAAETGERLGGSSESRSEALKVICVAAEETSVAIG